MKSLRLVLDFLNRIVASICFVVSVFLVMYFVYFPVTVPLTIIILVVLIFG